MHESLGHEESTVARQLGPHIIVQQVPLPVMAATKEAELQAEIDQLHLSLQVRTTCAHELAMSRP